MFVVATNCNASTNLRSCALSRSLSILVKSVVCSCAFVASLNSFFSKPSAFHPCSNGEQPQTLVSQNPLCVLDLIVVGSLECGTHQFVLVAEGAAEDAGEGAVSRKVAEKLGRQLRHELFVCFALLN